MSNLRVTVNDDGGPLGFTITEHVSLNASDRHVGERSARVEIGDLVIEILGYEEIAAERCEAIAAKLHQAALVLLRSAIPPGPDLRGALRPRLFRELEAGAAFRFEHHAGTESDHVWTKTGDREYSRVIRKRIGSPSAPVLELDETAAAAARAAAGGEGRS